MKVFLYLLTNFLKNWTTSERKISILLEKSSTESSEIIKLPYGDEAMSDRRVFEWFAGFRDGRMSLDDDEMSVTCCSDENI